MRFGSTYFLFLLDICMKKSSTCSNSRTDHKHCRMILAVRSRNFIKPDQIRRDPEEIKGDYLKAAFLR